MPFNCGNYVKPYSGSFAHADYNALTDITAPGLYHLEICDAYYRTAKSKDGQRDFQIIELRCAADDPNENRGRCRFNVFIDSVASNHLCYFLDLKAADGSYTLPDPIHHTGESTKTGLPYDFWTMDALRGREFYALLNLKGYTNSASGKVYPNFELVGFCDKRGFSAYDIATGAAAPCERHRDFIARLKEPSAPSADAAATTPAQGQYAPAPRQYNSLPRGTCQAPANYRTRAASAVDPEDQLPF